MNAAITRRDFVGGVGIALSGTLGTFSWAESPNSSDTASPYPPLRTGMRGSHAGSFEIAHQLRNGKRWSASETEDLDEEYDLVVVGAGISGLAAAWFYREANPNARILILDNHDDFGGHAKRNEFWHGDRLLLSHGGTINMQDFNQYGADAKRLIHALGIAPERYSDYGDKKFYASLGLNRGVFFDRETYGADRLVADKGKPTWPEFLAKTPLSDTAQRDIAKVYETREDYLAGLTPEQKWARLRGMSYFDYLADVVGVQRESLSMLNVDGYWAIGYDTLPAWVAARDGAPGTLGLGLAEDHDDVVYFRFPDGNASIARLLVQSLIPQVAPGTGIENVVTARFDYGQLDRIDASIRVRLNSTVVSVSHRGDVDSAEDVDITYVKAGKARRVRAAKTVLACYNSMIPYLCDELPEPQKIALSQSLKAPLVYTSVMLRNWSAFEKLGVHRVHCPGSYFNSVRLADPIDMGAYQHAKSPDEPIIIHMYRVPLAPGLPAQDQWRAGRHNLLTTSFEDFERHIRDQLGRMLGEGGFDPARDIEAITVNRWPHGYAYGQNPDTGEIAYLLDEVPAEKAPWIKARQPFGRIAIANSDAAANAMTEGAIGQAHRAVSELLS